MPRLAVALLALCAVLGLHGVVRASSVEGHFEVHTLDSKVFGDERTLYVWLPEAYAASEEHSFPLLLSLQGENLFDAAEAAGGDEWAVDELLQRSPTGLPTCIVVGVASAPNAVREFATPGSRDDAQATELVQHLIHEVLPFLEENWRIAPGAANRYLMGMGISAMTAIYGTWTQTEHFGGALAFDLPDVDTKRVTWPMTPPALGRPWLWLEQRSAERSRQSNSTLFTALRQNSEAQMLVAGPDASQPARLAAALRATPWARAQNSTAGRP